MFGRGSGSIKMLFILVAFTFVSFLTIITFLFMTVFRGSSEDTSFDDTEVVITETNTEVEEETVTEDEDKPVLDQVEVDSDSLFTGGENVNRFIREYYDVSGRALKLDTEGTSDANFVLYDGACKLDIESFNTEDTGEVKVVINFDEKLSDDDIKPVFQTCLRVFGVSEEEAEEITDGFSTEENRYDVDQDILEENYQDLQVEYTPTTIDYAQSTLDRVSPGKIEITCENYMQ